VKELNITQLNLTLAYIVFLQSLLGRYDSREAVLFADVIPFSPDSSVFLIRELTHDEWLDAVTLACHGNDTSETLQSSIQRVSAILKVDRAALFLSECFGSRVNNPVLEQLLSYVHTVRLMDHPMEEQLVLQLSLTRAQLVHRLGSPAQHFPYFSLATN